MATSDTNASPEPTPVPPRGGNRKPSRPTSKRPVDTRPGAPRPGPADTRRAALASKRRRTKTYFAGGAIAIIVAVVAILIGINATGGAAKSDTTAVAVTASSLQALNSGVTLQEMKAAAENYSLTSVGGSYPQVISGAPITASGKPDLLYLGAEYCPYCATERWPLVLALSKFGTFRNLSTIHSSAIEVDPNTATFSFNKSTYTSAYLTFTPVEEQTVDKQPLQTPTQAQIAIQRKYDPNLYIPFVYFNGKAQFNGAELNATLLGGKSFRQIADSITGGTSALASSITADAGVIVSNICAMTGGKPGSVCRLFPHSIAN